MVGEAGYQWPLFSWILFAIFIAAQAAAIFARGFRGNVTLLVVLIVLYVQDGVRNPT